MREGRDRHTYVFWCGLNDVLSFAVFSFSVEREETVGGGSRPCIAITVRDGVGVRRGSARTGKLLLNLFVAFVRPNSIFVFSIILNSNGAVWENEQGRCDGKRFVVPSARMSEHWRDGRLCIRSEIRSRSGSIAGLGKAIEIHSRAYCSRFSCRYCFRCAMVNVTLTFYSSFREVVSFNDDNDNFDMYRSML